MATSGSAASGAGPRWRKVALVAVIAGVVIVVVGAAAAWGLGLIGGGSRGAAGPPPRYLDSTSASGLDFTYDGSFEYAVGGGVAVLDCDDDGRPDLYLAGGAGPAALFHNDSTVGGELRFTRVASTATDLGAVNGAYPLDVDGDGIADLMTLRNGENVALRGLGHCRFERANEAWGLDGGDELTEAFSATWEAGATWPTIAFGNYAEPGNLDPETWCQTSELIRPSVAGGAQGTSGAHGADASFGAAVPLEPSFCALSMLFSDWDGSGRLDLRVSNDLQYYQRTDGEEQLWRVAPTEPPRLYTADEGWRRVQIQGMGIASHDVTGDGLPDVYLTSQAASKLQTLADGPSRPEYRDIGLPRGVNVAHPFTGDDMDLPSTAWHPEFDDVNNDGLIDLFVSKGNVTSQPDYAMQDPSNLLLGQPDGTFAEAADRAGIVTFDRARGAALVDLNLDGQLDLVESFYGAPVKVWRNDGPASSDGATPAHWLALRPQQPGPNVDAIGAVVDVRTADATYRDELTVGGGHAGGELGWSHVGLGPATSAEVRVRWPDGEVGPWQPVDADGFYVIERGASSPTRWEPAAGG